MNVFSKSKKQLRHFGLVMAIAIAVLASVLLWRGNTAWQYLYAVAAVFFITGLTFPRVLAPVEWLWMKFARIMGIITTSIILSIAYYFVVTPIGIVMRIAGRDPLRRRFARRAKSYWMPVDPDGPAGRPDKPY
jgi:hypothetical protein